MLSFELVLSTPMNLLLGLVVVLIGEYCDESPHGHNGDDIKVKWIRKWLSIDLGKDEYDDKDTQLEL